MKRGSRFVLLFFLWIQLSIVLVLMLFSFLYGVDVLYIQHLFQCRNWWMRHSRKSGSPPHPVMTKMPWTGRSWTSQMWCVLFGIVTKMLVPSLEWETFWCLTWSQSGSCHGLISSQVLACKDSGYDWFEQLLQNVSCLTFLNSSLCVFINSCCVHILSSIFF